MRLNYAYICTQIGRNVKETIGTVLTTRKTQQNYKWVSRLGSGAESCEPRFELSYCSYCSFLLSKGLWWADKSIENVWYIFSVCNSTSAVGIMLSQLSELVSRSLTLKFFPTKLEIYNFFYMQTIELAARITYSSWFSYSGHFNTFLTLLPCLSIWWKVW